MNFVKKMTEPVFLREDSINVQKLEALKNLKGSLNEEGRRIVESDIANVEKELIGEQNIDSKLRDCHMSMYILKNVHLQSENKEAWIDYLVVTRKLCFIIASRGLLDDVEITNTGEFLQYMDKAGVKIKTRIDSPLVQNENARTLLKELKMTGYSKSILQFKIDRNFDTYHKSFVVLGNPNTTLHAWGVRQSVKEGIIQADDLINYIQNALRGCLEPEVTDGELLKWANSFLTLHKEVELDFTAPYKEYIMV